MNVSFKEKVDKNADCRFKSLRLGCGSLRLDRDAEDRFRQVETRFRGAGAEFRSEGTSLRILRWDCGVSLIQFLCLLDFSFIALLNWFIAFHMSNSFMLLD